MNKCFLFTWRAPPHLAQRAFSCGVIDVSAFSRPAAGVQTCASVWRGSVASGLTWCSVGERADSVADSGVFFFSGHMSTPLSCRPDTCGCRTGRRAVPPCPFPPPTPYTLSSKNYPHLPPSAASAQFGGNCADEEILVAATKHDPNLFHHNTQHQLPGPQGSGQTNGKT